MPWLSQSSWWLAGGAMDTRPICTRMNPTSTHPENQLRFAARCCLESLCVNKRNGLLSSVAVVCCPGWQRKPSGFCAVGAVSADLAPRFDSWVRQNNKTLFVAGYFWQKPQRSTVVGSSNNTPLKLATGLPHGGHNLCTRGQPAPQ